MAPKQQFNVAIIGYGLSAKTFHVPFINNVKDFALYGIVQRSPKPGDDAAKDGVAVKTWRSVDEMYLDPEVDVVIITSTPETHFDLCKASLEAGKNVVVEKPFVPTAKEASELVEIAKKTGKKLAVYQNRRWDADFLTVKQIISEGKLGEIAEFETHFDRHRPDPPPESWKSKDAPAHGSIYDLGTHLIDQVYHLFGMPKKVTGFVGTQRRGINGGAHDSHTVLLHYEGPMLVTVKAGVVSPEEEQLRYWIRGTTGSFKKFHLDVQEGQLRLDPKALTHQDFGVDPESHYGTLIHVPHEKAKPNVCKYATVVPATYAEYYRVFAKALRGECEVPVAAEDARDVLMIIEAALLSSKEGRTIEL